MNKPLSVSDPGFEGWIGVARRDISPPNGIYCRNWGAGDQGAARGIHRPLTLTAITIQSEEDGDPLVLLAVDLGWFGSDVEEWMVRGPVVEGLGLDRSRVVLCLSHTHSAPAPVRNPMRGIELYLPYLEQVGRDAIGAALEALANRRRCAMTWTYSRCDLARNRDLPIDEEGRIHSCGFNPNSEADDTLLVGKITDESDRIVAVIVNYACHPTTLGWTNHLVSPDFVGAMREVVEDIFDAYCIFLNGAAGELAPREQYVDDVRVADRHGETLGYAVASALRGMLPARHRYEYVTTVPSGAPLGIWKMKPSSRDRSIDAAVCSVRLLIKHNYPTSSEIERQLRDCHEPLAYELLSRRKSIRDIIGNTDAIQGHIWIWKLGEALFVAQCYEAYSWIQLELRRRFVGHAIIWMNVSNGGFVGYMPPRESYANSVYQVEQSPFAPGCLEALCDACDRAIRSLLGMASNIDKELQVADEVGPSLSQ